METSAGLDLVFWFATESGPLRFRVNRQEAVCFFPTEQTDQLSNVLPQSGNWRTSPTKLENFEHQSMSALYLGSQRKLFDYRDKLAAADIAVVESDLKPTDRYLMERFVTGAAEISVEIDSRNISAGNVRSNKEFDEIRNGKLFSCEYRPKLNAVSIDIETDYEASRLYSIGMYSDSLSRVFIVGNEERDRSGEKNRSQVDLQYCADESIVIRAFLEEIKLSDPDVIMGWNIVNFDLRCLQKFSDRLGIPFLLGRDQQPVIWRKARDGNDRYYALSPGRAILDGIELMKSATYQFENFSLEYVSRQILGRGKLVDDVDQRGAEINTLFKENKPALAKYNLEDCRLVWDIFETEQLLAFAIERSLLTGLEVDRYGGSVAALDFLYLPRLHRKGFVAPSVDHDTAENISPGGYVMGSVPGIHDNVVVLDFKSLYPSIIKTFHVDPLALAASGKEEDPITGFDGGTFSRNEYILPELIETLWKARDKAKSQGNAVLSQAIKIIMNSFYGVLGTLGCRFFDPRLVSSITKRGHEIIIESKNYIENRGYKVIYGDTDSVFVLLDSVDESKVEFVAKQLVEELNEWWQEKLQNEYGIESNLEMEFETHFSKFLMPTVRGSDAGSKKRYAGVIKDSSEKKGYRLLFKGLESVRSDWSPMARKFQQQLYEKIFMDQPYEEYIKSVVSDLTDGKFENELVLRKRLRRKLGDYIKNVPPHVQAARKAEAIRKERGLPSLYESGGWIEYVITVNGPEPRQYRLSAIDFDFYIEKQLQPIADSILGFRSSSMDEILNKQIGLF